MELQRDIYEKLLQWKDNGAGSVLELQGARQVGKTFILKKFGRENFSTMIYVNMVESTGKDFLKCFAEAANWEVGEVREVVPIKRALQLYDSNFQDSDDVIVIIDEIQESAEIYNQIRTLAREFKTRIVVTGSYLGRIIEPEFFLPAGDLTQLTLETLTFEEFLGVFGMRGLYTEVDLYGKSKSEDYKTLAQYFSIYQKIGGYPAVVIDYVQNHDVNRCMNLIGDLINVFTNESKRYFSGIIDVNMFPKLFNAIALLMIQEKQGIRDMVSELSKIVYQEDSGRVTKQMLYNAISWLQESHVIGYVSKAIDCDYKQIRDNCRYYFLDVGVANFFLTRTGAPYNVVKGLLAENFVYLELQRRVSRYGEIAGSVPWFATYQKINGELDFYVRSLIDYKDYGIEVKSTDASAKTARRLLTDGKLNYLYLLKGESFGGIADERIFTVPVFLVSRITFDKGLVIDKDSKIKAFE